MIDHLRNLLSLDDTPLYNIKVVVGKTGVNMSTLRAWERRYGIPTPSRSERGHRLYSPRDVAILSWLRRQVEQGMTINQAASLLNQARSTEALLETASPLSPLTGQSPAPEAPALVQTDGNSLQPFQHQLLAAFHQFDLRQAHTITNQALALHSVTTILRDLFVPVLHEIGEGWAEGRTSVLVEHAASNFFRQRLLSLMQDSTPFCLGPRIMCGCVPDEQHELGMLMFSLLLQQHSWDVLYLGQSITVEGLIDAIRISKPRLVCFSARTVDKVPHLIEIGKLIGEAAMNTTLVYSGQVFEEHPELCQYINGVYLGTDLWQAVGRCLELSQQPVDQGDRLTAGSLH